MATSLSVPSVSITRITQPPGDHWFGYYDKTPWSNDGDKVLTMRTTFRNRQPTPNDAIDLGVLIPSESFRFERFASTTAWCWQQGTMLQWIPKREDTVVYNDRRNNQFVSVVRDLQRRHETTLDRALYALDPEGRYAVGLNFSRLASHRPGYGYEGVPDPYATNPSPAEDGLWKIDLDSGKSTLLLSLAAVVSLEPDPAMANHMHWLNHAQINTSGTRIACLHRWQPEHGPRQTRLLTVGHDGSSPRIVWSARHVSHYDWRNEDEILVWGGQASAPNSFWRISDAGRTARPFAPNLLREDGHCSFSPDRRWLVTDTYPNQARLRILKLVRVADEACIDIGAFYAPPELDGPTRVDLHPRWNREGTQLCIDSAHEGTRQMYVADVEPVTNST